MVHRQDARTKRHVTLLVVRLCAQYCVRAPARACVCVLAAKAAATSTIWSTLELFFSAPASTTVFKARYRVAANAPLSLVCVCVRVCGWVGGVLHVLLLPALLCCVVFVYGSGIGLRVLDKSLRLTSLRNWPECAFAVLARPCLRRPVPQGCVRVQARGSEQHHLPLLQPLGMEPPINRADRCRSFLVLDCCFRPGC